ncbi:MAG: TIGR02301 family protein [Parvibaculum sp.]|nr:TIGR02301 family protein [Parvibaculum sp.]
MRVGAFLVPMIACAFTPAHARADALNDGLTRLSEILGKIHHLRDVCGANDGPLWRNKMIDMINAANLDPDKRQQMIAHFNDAYYDARTVFPKCSGEAAKQANLLFDEAENLAAQLSGGRKNAASLF